MSSLLNSLIGHGDHAESKTVHRIQYEDVKVKSVVSSQIQTKSPVHQSQTKIHDLMSKLGSTHTQIDEFACKRTNEISESVKTKIEQIVQSILTQQQELLVNAEKESQQIEQDYKLKLMECINELDQEKATKLADFEKELNHRREQILENARKRIDSLNEEASRLKMNVLREAQAKTNSKIGEITGKVAQLGAEDASRRLTSTTTTIIKTQSQTEGNTIKHNQDALK